MPPFRLADVHRVEFYKRDEVAADLICCEVTLRDDVIFANEDMVHWHELIRKLECLDGFDVGWFSKVSQPPFAPCNHIAFEQAA